MKLMSRCAGVVVLLLCFGAQANEVERESSLESNASSDSKQEIEVPEYSPTQILCIKQRRTGSRVVENKCQTIAAWKRELDEKSMRTHMIKSRAKSGWEYTCSRC